MAYNILRRIFKEDFGKYAEDRNSLIETTFPTREKNTDCTVGVKVCFQASNYMTKLIKQVSMKIFIRKSAKQCSKEIVTGSYSKIYMRSE